MFQKIIIPVLIFLFFGTMMMLLIQNQIIPRIQYGTALPVQAKQIKDEWRDIDESMNVTFNGQDTGLLRQVVTRNDDRSYSGQTVFLLRHPFIKADLLVRSKMNKDLELESVEVTFQPKSGGEIMTITGFVLGTDLLLKISSPNGARFREFALRDRPTLNVSTSNMLEMLMDNPNEQYVLDVYEPIWNFSSDAAVIRLGTAGEIDFNGEKVFASVVESNLKSFSSKMYFDETNTLIRRTLTFGKSDESSSQSGPSFEIVMDRVEDHELMAESTELLNSLNEQIDITPKDVIGEDYGDVPALLSLPGMLMQGSLQ